MTELMRRRRALMAAKTGGKSDMHGWTDGVAYTDIEIVENEYVGSGGKFTEYSEWDRSGYVPCNGASTIVFPRTGFAGSNQWNAFYDANHGFISMFSLNRADSVTVDVPEQAAFFAISLGRGPQGENKLAAVFNNSVIPYK